MFIRKRAFNYSEFGAGVSYTFQAASRYPLQSAGGRINRPPAVRISTAIGANFDVTCSDHPLLFDNLSITVAQHGRSNFEEN